MAEFAAAAILALVHLIGGRITHGGARRTRDVFLSAAGGVSLAFAFVFLLPELARSQRIVQSETGGFLGRDAYLLALLGILVFYALDRLMLRSVPAGAGRRAAASAQLFWAHISSFALYNALIGYLIAHEGEPETGNLALFTVAVALHFIANDHAMREHHAREYDRIGRWLLVPAPLVGWLIGTLLPVGDAAVSMLLAFLVGAIVLNVLKEELPEERTNRFIPFVSGAIAYTALLLLM